MTNTEMRNNARDTFFSSLVENLHTNGIDTYQTDTASVTVPITLEDGTELYGTLKFTLHKTDFDLDDKVAEWEEKVAEQEQRKADAAAKKAAAEKKRAERAAKKTTTKKEKGEKVGE